MKTLTIVISLANGHITKIHKDIATLDNIVDLGPCYGIVATVDNMKEAKKLQQFIISRIGRWDLEDFRTLEPKTIKVRIAKRSTTF